MTTPLPAALRAAARGLCTVEAAAGLIITHGTWIGRDDFARFIHHGTGTAAIDWEAAIGALDIGELPSCRGEADATAGSQPRRPGTRQPRRRHHRHRRM